MRFGHHHHIFFKNKLSLLWLGLVFFSCLFLSLIWTPRAWAAPVLIDSTTSFFADPDQTGSTFSFDTTDVADSVLVVTAYYNAYPAGTASNEITGITYGGTSLTRVCKGVNGNVGFEIWYLVSPTAGTANIVTTATSAMASSTYFAVQAYGVDTTDPIANSMCSGGNDIEASVSVTAAVDSLAIGGVASWEGTTTHEISSLIDPLIALDKNGVSNSTTGMTNTYVVASISTGRDYLYQDFVYNLGYSNVDFGIGAVFLTGNGADPSPIPSPEPSPTPTPSPGGDVTPPEVTLTLEPAAYSTASATIAGTSTDPESTITSVVVTGTSWNGATSISPASIDATAVSGTFGVDNSVDWTVTVTGLLEHYALTITTTNSEGLTSVNYVNSFADTTIPTMVVSNIGLTPSTDTTPTYTATVTDPYQTDLDESSGVQKLEFKIWDLTTGTDDYAWTEATMDGGYSAGDHTVTFTFTSPALTRDGVKYVLARATDVAGNVTWLYPEDDHYTVDRITVEAIDTAPPIIQLYDMVPNPIQDPTPKLQGKVKDDTAQLTSNIASIDYSFNGADWTAIEPFDGQGVNHGTEEAFSVLLPTLTPGSYTIYVRAADAAGNHTDETTHIHFTVEAVDPTLTSTELSKTETFDTQTDRDIITGENYIWGNGKLRLAEAFAPTLTAIKEGGYGTRYDYEIQTFNMESSAAGGFWVGKLGHQFSYFDANNTETVYDLGDAPISYASPAYVEEIKEVVVGGNYHLWIAADDGIVGLDFGNSPSNGIQQVHIFKPDQVGGVTELLIDDRTSDYGIYINYNDSTDGTKDGFIYYKPNLSDWGTAGTEVRYNVDDGLTNTSVVTFYLDEGNNHLWASSYGEGICVLDDNGTPLVKTDDQHTLYSAVSQQGIFAIGQDNDGKTYYGGNGGLSVITDDNGTFTAADDTIINLADEVDLGYNTVYTILYSPGDGVVGGQFFLSNETGEIKYLNYNDTYSDPLDDQIISINSLNDLYPGFPTDMILLDYDTIRFVARRKGIYDVDLHRTYAASGYAESLTDARIEGRLDVDFITLNNVNFIVNAGGYSYEVSNDGGEHWYPIVVGQTVNFPTSDYRIKFRINMVRGSTPVIDGYALSYSAYPSADDRGKTIQFSNVPSEAYRNTDFTYKILGVDDLGNPISDELAVTMVLKKVSDNSTEPSYSPLSATVSDGSVTISNARANVVGEYKLQATYNGTTITSGTITFKEPTIESPDLISPDNNSYTGNTRPTFSWYSKSYKNVNSYNFDVDNGDSGDFVLSGLAASGIDQFKNKYNQSFANFLDSDNSNNTISLYTKSSGDWASDQNDGLLKEGKRVWKVTALDNVGNPASSSRNLLVDLTSPAFTSQKIDGSVLGAGAMISDTTPNLAGRITDPLAGDKGDNKVASGPKKITITVAEKQGSGLYHDIVTHTINLTDIYWLSGGSAGQKVTDNSSNLSSKYADFSFTLSSALELGTYKITVSGFDLVGNVVSSVSTIKVVTVEELLTEEERKAIEEELAKTGDASASAAILNELGSDLNIVKTIPGEQAAKVNPVLGFFETIKNSVLDLFSNLRSGNVGAVLAQIRGAAVEAAKDVLPVSSGLATAAIPTASILSLLAQAGWDLSPKFLLRALQALGILPKGRPQGMVFDSQTNKGVAFALLTFESTNKITGKILETVVSDVNGVFQGIKLLPGSYKITVGHQEFSFPTRKHRPAYLTTTEFYRGETIDVKSEKDLQVLLAPVDGKAQTDIKENWAGRWRLFISRYNLKNMTIPLFIFSIVIAAIYPTPFNFIVLGINLVVILRQVMVWLQKPNLVGNVIDETQKAVSDAIIRLGLEQDNQLVGIVSSDKKGQFKAFVPPGKYQVMINKPGLLWQRQGAQMSAEVIDTTKQVGPLKVQMVNSQKLSQDLLG